MALGAVMVVVELVRPSFKIKKRLKKIRHFARPSAEPVFVGVAEDLRNRFYDRYAHPLTTAMPTPLRPLCPPLRPLCPPLATAMPPLYDRYAPPLRPLCPPLTTAMPTP